MLYQLSYTPIYIHFSRPTGPLAGDRSKGKNSQRINSIRGTGANRGNAMELASSGVVVDRQGLEPRTDRL